VYQDVIQDTRKLALNHAEGLQNANLTTSRYAMVHPPRSLLLRRNNKRPTQRGWKRLITHSWKTARPQTAASIHQTPSITAAQIPASYLSLYSSIHDKPRSSELVNTHNRDSISLSGKSQEVLKSPRNNCLRLPNSPGDLFQTSTSPLVHRHLVARAQAAAFPSLRPYLQRPRTLRLRCSDDSPAL